MGLGKSRNLIQDEEFKFLSKAGMDWMKEDPNRKQHPNIVVARKIENEQHTLFHLCFCRLSCSFVVTAFATCLTKHCIDRELLPQIGP